MDTTTFYFSATGNPLKVARQITAEPDNTLVLMNPDEGKIPATNAGRTSQNLRFNSGGTYAV